MEIARPPTRGVASRAAATPRAYIASTYRTISRASDRAQIQILSAAVNRSIRVRSFNGRRIPAVSCSSRSRGESRPPRPPLSLASTTQATAVPATGTPSSSTLLMTRPIPWKAQRNGPAGRLTTAPTRLHSRYLGGVVISGRASQSSTRIRVFAFQINRNYAHLTALRSRREPGARPAYTPAREV